MTFFLATHLYDSCNKLGCTDAQPYYAELKNPTIHFDWFDK